MGNSPTKRVLCTRHWHSMGAASGRVEVDTETLRAYEVGQNIPANRQLVWSVEERAWVSPGGVVYRPIPEPPTSTDHHAFKVDDGKPNWFLLMSGQGCARALAAVVRVLSFAVRPKDKGGKGYTEHSWRLVPNAKERYESALYRHLNKLALGETHDDESGESHWAHVATNALFLAELHHKEQA